MNYFKYLKWVGAALVSLALGTSALAQDKDAKKKDAAPTGGGDEMAMMMELAKPGPNHKLLLHSVGTWNYAMKWWMDPGAPPTESSGTAKFREAMGGRYLISEYLGMAPMPGPDGKMTPQEFKGLGTDAFDNAKKKFVSTWIDNMGTGIMMAIGTYDAKTKTITYLSEYEMMPGKITKMRQTVKFEDDDHTVYEFFEIQDGKDVKNMEIKATRVK